MTYQSDFWENTDFSAKDNSRFRTQPAELWWTGRDLDPRPSGGLVRTCKPDILRPSVNVVYQAELPAHFPVEQPARTFNPYRIQTQRKRPGFPVSTRLKFAYTNWVTSVTSQAFEGQVRYVLRVLQLVEAFLADSLLHLGSGHGLFFKKRGCSGLKVLSTEFCLSCGGSSFADLTQPRC